MDIDVCLSCDQVEMRRTDKGWAPSKMVGEGWFKVVMVVIEGSKAGTNALVTTTSCYVLIRNVFGLEDI